MLVTVTEWRITLIRAREGGHLKKFSATGNRLRQQQHLVSWCVCVCVCVCVCLCVCVCVCACVCGDHSPQQCKEPTREGGAATCDQLSPWVWWRRGFPPPCGYSQCSGCHRYLNGDDPGDAPVFNVLRSSTAQNLAAFDQRCFERASRVIMTRVVKCRCAAAHYHQGNKQRLATLLPPNCADDKRKYASMRDEYFLSAAERGAPPGTEYELTDLRTEN